MERKALGFPVVWGSTAKGVEVTLGAGMADLTVDIVKVVLASGPDEMRLMVTGVLLIEGVVVMCGAVGVWSFSDVEIEVAVTRPSEGATDGDSLPASKDPNTPESVELF